MFNADQYIQLSASTITLDHESQKRFAELLGALVHRFQPLDLAEYLCIEEMAFAKWRLRRNVAFENCLLDHQQHQQQPLRQQLAPILQAALAFADDRATHTTLHHRESSLSRSYTRATRDLDHLRQQPQNKKIPFEPNTPQTRESAAPAAPLTPVTSTQTEKIPFEPNTPPLREPHQPPGPKSEPPC